MATNELDAPTTNNVEAQTSNEVKAAATSNSVNEYNHNSQIESLNKPADIFTPPKDWLKLNVGGTILCTSQRTLRKYPSCILNSMLHESQDNIATYFDENGALLIDRDPKYFSVFLNYMRSDRFYLEGDLSENALIAEAEFFNIPGLLDELKQKVKEKHCEMQANSVHRVCSLKPDELSAFLSSLSDGWKLCQVLPNSNGSTYLVIVSKSFDTPLSPPNQPLAPKVVKVFDDKPKENQKPKSKSFKFL